LQPALDVAAADRSVVSSALLQISQGFVSFAKLFEFFLRFSIVAIRIGVGLFSSFSIRVFDFVLCGAVGDTKNFVVAPSYPYHKVFFILLLRFGLPL
jgi:hypothetical protein